MWKRRRSTDKRYPGDNRLILPKSPYRRQGLAPRCRLVSSWGWSRSQGLGCSPIKAARELGSERRETVRSLSSVRERNLRRTVPDPDNGPRLETQNVQSGISMLTPRTLACRFKVSHLCYTKRSEYQYQDIVKVPGSFRLSARNEHLYS